LRGRKETFKSSVFAVLGGEWYTSDIAQLGTKNAQEQIIGVWIVELDEMAAVTRAADIAAVKSSISRRFDRFRYTWGRRVAVYQRQCIVGGTVNKDTWQRDETGGRRWFPVKCGIIQIDLLIEDRDHLWAEARDRYLTGEKWHLEEPELVEAARVEVDKRYQPDVWEEKIASFVAPLTDVRFDDILGECCLNIPLDRWNKRHQQRVGAVLRRLGWIRKLVRLPGQPQSLIPRWRWLREVK
jgi:predicted P-loop ATPase